MSSQTVEGYRLSPIQRRVWSLVSRDPGCDRRVRATVRLEGALNRDALRRAIEAVVRQHEALRTSLHLFPGVSVPVQVVNECDAFTLHSLEPGVELAADLLLPSSPVAKESMNPALSAAITKVDDGTHLLQISGPAVSVDPRTLQLAVAGIASAYDALTQGSGAAAGEALQYPDISEWLNKLAEDQDAAAGRNYWKQFAAPFAESSIPPAKDPTSCGPAQRVHLNLHPEVMQKLLAGEAAGRWKVSSFVLAAWRALLQRVGYEAGCVGVAFDGRTDESLAGAMGPMTRYLPICLPAALQATFLQTVEAANSAVEQAGAWQDYFVWEALADGPEGGDNSFAFSFDHFHVAGLPSSRALRFKTDDLYGTLDHSGLRLTCLQTPDEIRLSLTWLPQLYSWDKAATLAESVAAILESAVNNPAAPVSQLAIVATRTQRKLVYENNRTFADFSRVSLLHEQFSLQAARSPHAVAVIDSEEEVTYAELNRRVLRVAHHLRKRGVGPESLVGIYAERSVEMVVGLLAILKSGGAYVPLDPGYPMERLEYMIRSSRASLVLSSAGLKKAFAPPGVETVSIREFYNAEARLNGGESLHVHAENPAYVIYTSGSTGEPKGVMITHGSIRNHMCWMQQTFPFTGADRVLQKTAFSFDASVWEFYAPLLAGGALVMAKPGGQSDAEYLVNATQKHGITVLQLVPTQLRMMLEQPSFHDCRSLKRVFCGGEALEEELVKTFHQKLPWAKLYNLYGPTEATIDASYALCKGDRDHGTAPIGKPVCNTQLYILDEAMNLVPEGVKGELFIGGAGLARGYANRPDLTAERFVPSPFAQSQGERIYRTGDLAQWLDDGSVEFFGRLDHQIKIRGYRVELGEIEEAILRYPGVKQAIVAAREDSPGDKQLAAYILAQDGKFDANESALRAFLKETLPDYMVPAAFVVLEKLPLLPNGKVDRKALPAPQSAGRKDAYVGPKDQMEEIICGIFTDVLKREQVSTDQSFFDIGGHSLVATQAISRLRTIFAIEIPLRALFESPTAAGLARHIRAGRAEASGLTAIQKRSPGDAVPVSFAQQRLWFLDQLEPGNAAYNMPFALRLKGKIDKKALQESIAEISRRHETLRTRFKAHDGSPVQEIVPELALKIQNIDLRSVPAEEREAKARTLAQSDAQRPFKLGAAPLVRVKLIQLQEEEHILLLTMHHIVSDGWSMGVMVRELTELYEAFQHGRPSPLAELPVQYADYAAWQREWLQAAVLQEQVGYWRKQLEDAPVLELPTDRPRPATPSYAGAVERTCFDKELTESLKRLSQREGVTLFMTLLGSFQALLARYAGQWDVSVGTDVANRNREEAEGLIGFFVNTLVLRNRMAPEQTARELLKQVRETTLSAYAHQDLPFEKLVQELDPERHLGRNPLFQVLFTMQNMPVGDIRLTGVQVTPETANTGTSKFDLNLIVGETGTGMGIGMEYSTDLFDAGTIQRMLEHWETMLRGMAARPESRLSELPMMSEAEWQRIGVEANRTEKSYSADTLLPQLFEQQAERTPDAMAATCGDASITHLELNRRANRAAHLLRSKGVGPEVVVALFMERGIEFLTAMLAVFKAGGAYMPLDPKHPQARHQQVLRQSGVTRLITTKGFGEAAGVIDLDILYIEDAIQAGDEENPPAVNRPNHLAYVIYTSGSTGTPKGAMVEHAGMLNHLLAKIGDLQMEGRDVIVQNASQCFDISVWQFLAGLVAGARVHIVSNEMAVDPRGLFAEVAARQVTVLEIVPSLLRAILEPLNEGGMNAPPLPTLRWLILTGEALPADLARRWRELYPAIPVMNAYGPTECSDDVTHQVVREAASLTASYVPIGRPIINTKLYILDASLQPVPAGIPGELYVGGICVGRGYCNAPERTAQAFVPDHLTGNAGTRLYRTGDLVRMLPSGEIVFLGRTDHQIKLRGYRIELGEIENALEQHEAVSQAVVTVRNDQASEQRLVGYIVVRKPVETAELRAALRDQLPEYMVPSVFVRLEAMPLSGNGKIDRKALPVPSVSEDSRNETYVAPATPEEEAIAAIWAELLNVDRVGASDNFFDLGGHSLLATQVVSRIRTVLGIDLPLRVLFEAATVSELAQAVIEYKAANPGEAFGAPDMPIRRDASMEQMLAGLENLSEEEVELLLAMEEQGK